MGKCWIIENLGTESERVLGIYESNPLEPIQGAADRLKHPTIDRIRLLIAESAIAKCIAIMEGREP